MAGLALLVVNLEGYPIIDEFARPGSDDGHNLLDARKKIKVTPNGSISPLRSTDGIHTFFNTSSPVAYNVRRPPHYQIPEDSYPEVKNYPQFFTLLLFVDYY